MEIKRILREELDVSTTLMQAAELQKVLDAVSKIPDVRLADQSVNQQKTAFMKLVQAQLQQKKMEAQQAQAAQQAQKLSQGQNQNSSQISTLAQ